MSVIARVGLLVVLLVTGIGSFLEILFVFFEVEDVDVDGTVDASYGAGIGHLPDLVITVISDVVIILREPNVESGLRGGAGEFSGEIFWPPDEIEIIFAAI